VNSRITFLHYLFIDAELNEVSNARSFNSVDVIGSTPKERKMTLEFINIKYANKIPKEKKQKKQSFAMNII